jgi:hypothetical protein
MEPGTHRSVARIALAAACAAPLQTAACARPPVTPPSHAAPLARVSVAPQPELRVVRVRLQELDEHLPRYIGYTIEVTGTIRHRRAGRVFSLDDHDAEGTGVGIAVYAPGTLASSLREGTKVTITGVVKTLTRDDVIDAGDWPAPHEDPAWLRGPVLVARQIEWRGARLSGAVASGAASQPSGNDQEEGASAYTRTSRVSCSVDPSRRSTRALIT